MSNILPVIPQKDGGACGDAARVLRGVFVPPTPNKTATQPQHDEVCSNVACMSPVSRSEYVLQQRLARGLSVATPGHVDRPREPPPPPPPPSDARSPKATLPEIQALINRKDLVPRVQEELGELWVRDALGGASAGAGAGAARGGEPRPDHLLPTLESCPRDYSSFAVSIGRVRSLSSPRATPPPLPPPPPPLPCLGIAQPDHVDFVNFAVGKTYKRVVRVCGARGAGDAGGAGGAGRVRVAVVPPRLASVLRAHVTGRGGARGLTPGVFMRVTVRFTPRDTRPLRDELRFRLEGGQDLVCPIACYMQPPLLKILLGERETEHRASETRSMILSARCLRTAETASLVLELGAQLLGDAHSAALLLRCDAKQAAFVLLTEQHWLTKRVENGGGETVYSGEFSWRPARWRGGGVVRGEVTCAAADAAADAGLRAAHFYITAFNGVARPLTIIADTIRYSPSHVQLLASLKEYDICEDSDEDCQFWVRLGCGFPNSCLTTQVTIVNESPVWYSYRWLLREWCGESESWGEDASSSTLSAAWLSASWVAAPGSAAAALRVQPPAGRLAPRSSAIHSLTITDTGQILGNKRAALMLVLDNVPRLSFPRGFNPVLIEHKSERGFEEESPRCTLVAHQAEVWWDVVALRLAATPLAVRLTHSPRVAQVSLRFQVTQMTGCEGVEMTVEQRPPPATAGAACPLPAGPCCCPKPHSLRLSPDSPSAFNFDIHLNNAPNDLFKIVLASGDVRCVCEVRSRRARRWPRVKPAVAWLGPRPAASDIHQKFILDNNTYQNYGWESYLLQWWGGVECPGGGGGGGCGGATSMACRRRGCQCLALTPHNGFISHQHNDMLVYHAVAKDEEGIVVSLVNVTCDEVVGTREDCACETMGKADEKAVCTVGDGGDGRIEEEKCKEGGEGPEVEEGEGREAAAVSSAVDLSGFVDVGELDPRRWQPTSVLAFRVCAPRVILRVLQCYGVDEPETFCAAGCALSACEGALLRPAAALRRGQALCARLALRNLTPVTTTLQWEPAPAADDGVLEVDFFPTQLSLEAYQQVYTQVSVRARRVCGRRVRVRRGAVAGGEPLYLAVDAAVEGVVVTLCVNVGRPDKAELRLRETADTSNNRIIECASQVFIDEDLKRKQYQERKCECRWHWEAIPRPPPPVPVPGFPHVPSIEILDAPPPLRRACRCDARAAAAPPPPSAALHALQYQAVPIHTEQQRTVLVRSAWCAPLRYRADLRTHNPRFQRRLKRDFGVESVLVGASGARLVVRGGRGQLAPGRDALLTVAFTATVPGLYKDQLAIQIEHLEPVVIDVWCEAIGPVLCPPLAPAPPPPPPRAAPRPPADVLHTLWFTDSDPQRTLHLTNRSLNTLTVVAYILHETDRKLKFRLFYQLEDQPLPTCPCMQLSTISDSHVDVGEASVETPTYSAEEEEEVEEEQEPVGTGIELFLGTDYGEQVDDSGFKVSPEKCELAPEENGKWRIECAPTPNAPVPSATLMLRTVPHDVQGDGWYRTESEPVLIALRYVLRAPHVQLSCDQVHVSICALSLPLNDVFRVRKYFRVHNSGRGWAACTLSTTEPWSVALATHCRGVGCGAGCRCHDAGPRVPPSQTLELELQPYSSSEVSVEVQVSSAEVWPAAGEPDQPPPPYIGRVVTTNSLQVNGEDNQEILSIPLILEMHYPRLRLEPEQLNLGFVNHGETRKAYFTVFNDSDSAIVGVVVTWSGDPAYSLHPREVHLGPHESARFYLQFTSRWEGRVTRHDGLVAARAGCGAGGWCRARAGVSAYSTRDRALAARTHDHTDDPWAVARPPAPPQAWAMYNQHDQTHMP